jgi:hypothetical protein
MPLTLPNLDDRTYKDLVQEALAAIPAHAPEWTNHNPSDPGITLVELFAYLTEMLIYRVDRVTEANRLTFLKLLRGPEWTPAPSQSLSEQIREAVLELREPNRAVTCEDFERLARKADPLVARARCVARRDLGSGYTNASDIDTPGFVSVVIVPDRSVTDAQARTDLIQKVRDYLEPRRLLTTQVQVVTPRYVAFGVRLTLVLKPDVVAETYLNFALDPNRQNDLDNHNFSTALRDAFGGKGISFSSDVTITVQEPGSEWLIRDNQYDLRYLIRKESGMLNVYEDTARLAAIKVLKEYFDPLVGGELKKGWPFGRNVYVSEIYQLLDQLPGIDYVTRSLDPQTHEELDELTADASRLIRNAQDALVAIELRADELIDVQQLTFQLTLVSPQG